jgi:hypothetical protein
MRVATAFSQNGPSRLRASQFANGESCHESRRPRSRSRARLIILSQNEPTKYGYARVSTGDQSPTLQLAALKWAGRKTIFKDEG